MAKSKVLLAVVLGAVFSLGLSVAEVQAEVEFRYPFLFVQNTSPNPAGHPEGVVLQIGVYLRDATTKSPITTAIVSGNLQGETYQLDYTPNKIFQDLGALYFARPQFDGQRGMAWIQVQEGPGIFTHDLDKIRIVPTTKNIRFSDASTTPTITWDPVYYDDDLDPSTQDIEIQDYRVRILSGADFEETFRSTRLYSNSYTIPFALSDQPVYLRVEARTSPLKSRSDTFTDFLFQPGGSITGDSCTSSDLRATVTVNKIETGVTNDLFPSGCSIADLVKNCEKGTKVRGELNGDYVKCVENLTNDLFVVGAIEDWEQAAINSAAVRGM